MGNLVNWMRDIFSKKQHQTINSDLARWIDNTLDRDIPDEVVAFCFNLYEEADSTWAMELIGTESFDLEDEDWACDEVTDFGSRDNLFVWKMNCKWKVAFGYIANELKKYLKCGKHAKLLRSKEAIGVGFVDGDIEILFRK